jgi:hypothetical protein
MSRRRGLPEVDSQFTRSLGRDGGSELLLLCQKMLHDFPAGGARHTPSCEQMYSSAASSAPIRCGWPVANGCTAIAMTRGTVWPSRYSVSNWRFSIASNSGTDIFISK